MLQQLFAHRSVHTTSVYLQHVAPAAAVAEATGEDDTIGGDR
jgi:hypothetical protein